MKAEYQRQTAAATMERILRGVDPWVAFGQFLDDWRGEQPPRRARLVEEPLPPASDEALRWAALIAGAVDWL